MSVTREKIITLRDTAERLMLGTPGERWLRACVVELCNILVGIDQQHAELDISGARYPAPVRHVAVPTPPLAPPPAPIPPHVAKPGGAPAPAGTVLRPGMSIGEMQAVAAQRKQGLRAVPQQPAAAPPVAPVPEPPAVDPTAPDPAGDFEERLASLATEGEAVAPEGAATGQQEGA